MSSVRVLTVALALATAGRACLAEVIVLSNGREMEGQVERTGDQVTIELSRGVKFTVPASEVREIRPGTWQDEYARRLAALGPAPSPEARLQLATWCRAKNLLDEAEVELEAVLAAQPDNRAARKSLEVVREATLRHRELEASAPPKPVEEAPVESAQPAPAVPTENETQPPAEGSDNFASQHFSVTSDGAAGSARKAGETAEKLVENMAALLEVPANATALGNMRVNVRCFSGHKTFGEATKGFGPESAVGHYSVRRATAYVQIGEDGRLDVRHLRTVRHECGHAFVWHVLGIASHDPWLHEALATVMEADGGDARIVPERLWYVARCAEKIDLSLDALFASHFDHGTEAERSLNYVRVWTFAHFMLCSGDAKRKAEFLDFLKDCRGWDADLRGALQYHFPDRKQLEADWRSHVNSLLAKHMPSYVRAQVPEPHDDPEDIRREVVSSRRGLEGRRMLRELLAPAGE